MVSMRRCCDSSVPGRPGTTDKDSADEYSSQEGPSPAVSVGNVEALTKETSTHQRVPVVGSVKDKCPVVCKLILRHAAMARKIGNCRSRERSIIAILPGATITPFAVL